MFCYSIHKNFKILVHQFNTMSLKNKKSNNNKKDFYEQTKKSSNFKKSFKLGHGNVHKKPHKYAKP